MLVTVIYMYEELCTTFACISPALYSIVFSAKISRIIITYAYEYK